MDLFGLADRLLADAMNEYKDAHMQEMIQRAHTYTLSRLGDGHITDEAGVRLSFASFADGFCTGFHRGSGTTCPEERAR